MTCLAAFADHVLSSDPTHLDLTTLPLLPPCSFIRSAIHWNYLFAPLANMSTSLFASPFRYLSHLVASPNRPSSTDSPSLDRSLTEATSPSIKRKAIDEEDLVQPKKRRVTSLGHRNRSPDTDGNEAFSSHNTASHIRGMPAELDRSLMPPPMTPHSQKKNLQRPRSSPSKRLDSDAWYDDDDSNISFISTAITKKRMEPLDSDLMEEARRQIAAITLPANSGIWSQTERELFFHLAYRGFEPLLPQNWMLDFDTLPISVFAHKNSSDPALIQNVRDNQFRASHALRRLFEAGQEARDRNHVSPGVRRERVLEKSVKRYLYWALTDVGLRPRSRAKYIPVHVVVARKKSQSTLQTLEQVAKRLQRLSQRHQAAQNIHSSVETHSLYQDDTDETRVADDDASTPTLIGLVIISAVLVVVTLSPFAGPPSANPLPASPDAPSQECTNISADRLRIIAELDFSQKDQDVWNALGVAIAAMQVRKEATKANPGLANDDSSVMDWDASRLEDDHEGMSTLSMLRLDESDPDL